MECTYLDRASFAIEYVIRVQLRLVHKASFATKKNDQSSIILTPKEDFLELSMNEMNNTRSPGLPRLYRVVSSPVSPDEALSIALRIIHAESFVFDFSFEAQSNSSLANEVSGKENSKPRVSLDSKANHELLALSSIPLPPANSELLEYNLQNVAHTLDDVGVQGSRGTLNLREFIENESDGGSEGGNLVIMSPLARRSTGNFVPETFTNVDSKSHKCPTEETECTSRVHSKSAALDVLEEGPVWLEMYTPSIAECLAILGDARGNKSVITQMETILSCLNDTCSVEDIHIGNHLDGFLIHFDSNCLFLTRGQSLVIRFHPATTNSTSIPQMNQQEEVLKTTLEAPILADETSRKQTARNKQAGETNQRLRCLSPASRHHRYYRTDNRYRLWYNNNSVREIISRLRTECRRLDALYSPVQDSSSQPFSLEDGRRPLMQPNKDLRLEIKTELADVPLRHDLCAAGSKSIFHISSCVISCILSHLYIHRGVERSRDLIQRTSALEEIVLVLESNEKMDILRRLSHLRRELSAERQAITRCNLVVRNLARCQILTSSDMDRLKSDIQRLLHTYSMVIDTLSSINGNFNAFQSSCMEQHAHSTTTFMQHLTCMTSLMLPLSFVTALLGMNVRVPWQTEIVDDPSAEENQKFLSPRAFIIIMLLSLGYIIVTVLLYIISQTWALREQREICMTGLEDDRIVSPKKSNLTFSSVSAYRRRRDFELAKSHSSRFKSVSFGFKH